MNGFARRKAQSKAEIRKAACELFSQFGVDKVSIADIARKAGVAPATLYNHYGNKEALAREFVASMVEQLVDRVQEVLSPEKPYHEKIAAFIQFLSATMAHERPSLATHPLFASSIDLQNDPEIKKIREAAQKRMIGILFDLMQEGKAQGQVNPDLSEEALSVYFTLFMDLFTNPELQHRFSQQPALGRDLALLMIYGLNGQRI